MWVTPDKNQKKYLVESNKWDETRSWNRLKLFVSTGNSFLVPCGARLPHVMPFNRKHLSVMKSSLILECATVRLDGLKFFISFLRSIHLLTRNVFTPIVTWLRFCMNKNVLWFTFFSIITTFGKWSIIRYDVSYLKLLNTFSENFNRYERKVGKTFTCANEIIVEVEWDGIIKITSRGSLHKIYNGGSLRQPNEHCSFMNDRSDTSVGSWRFTWTNGSWSFPL